MRGIYSFKDIIGQYAIYFIVFLLAVILLTACIFIYYIRKTRIFKAEQAKAHDKLEAALKKANSANEAKTNFLSSVSHDIRTPMNAIVGMTAIAQMNLDDKDKVSDCLGKIELSSRHLLTLINNVLDISKIESRNLQLNPTEFSLNNMIAGLLHIVRSQIDDKNIEFIVSVPTLKYDMVYADEVRIDQIFINILTNAIKYTPDGGRIIVELTEELMPSGEAVRLVYCVEDNGIGMSEEFMKNMYNIFSRAKDSRIDKIQGTGLGLAIVKQMVDMMHGTIDCVSEEGKGTKFTITLDVPLCEEDGGLTTADENIAGIAGVSSQSEGGVAFSGRHLLVAEDNELNWEVIEGILGMFDITAERAENGKACVDMLDSAEPGTYDLVLMDIQMPVMNGREAARVIRANSRKYVKDIPIIAMTADAFAEDIKACVDAGMNGHVSKPLDISNLFQEMKIVMGGG